MHEDSNSPAISSNTGAIILHGIHQAAEKSTTSSLSALLVKNSSNSLEFAMCLTLVGDCPPLTFMGEDDEEIEEIGRPSENISSSDIEDDDVEVQALDEEEDAVFNCLDANNALDRNLEEGLLRTAGTSSRARNATMHTNVIFILSLDVLNMLPFLRCKNSERIFS